MSQTGNGSPPGVPGWVKLIGIIFVLLVLLVIILHLSGIGLGCPPPGSGHGPPGCPSGTPSARTSDVRLTNSWSARVIEARL